MRSAYHVARLPRPARLRFRVGSVRYKPGYARAEADDWKVAQAQAALEAGLPRPPRQSSKLPSMFDARPSLATPAQDSADAGPSHTASTKDKQRALPSMEDAGYDPDMQPVSNKAEATARASPRKNAVGVQLLSPSLHAQLFPGPSLPAPPPALLDISRAHLEAHGLSPSAAGVLPEISFDLPPLQGPDIRAHFHNLGAKTAEPYLSMAQACAAAPIPPIPTAWVEQPGWTRYTANGAEAVESVKEDVVIFDVETLYKVSPYSVMATAASSTAWYAWLDPAIFADPATGPHTPSTLIPLFPNTSPTLAIGHNVGYDRARVKEEYALERTGTRWLDTLSLHVATRGITSVQRPAWVKHRKTKAEDAARRSDTLAALHEVAEASGDAALAASLAEYAGDDADAADDGAGADAASRMWMDVTSTNSLAEVAALHCGKAVDKSARNRFGDEALTGAEQMRGEIQELLTYCATDVRTTHDVFRAVLPLFIASCPHPATFAGVLAMGNAFLPVDDSWERYLANAEGKYVELADGVRRGLRLLADKLRKRGKVEGDPWSEQLDWTPKVARWDDEVDAGANEGEPVAVSEAPQVAAFPATPIVLPQANDATAQPTWYALLTTDSAYLTTKSQRDLLPLLLRLSYRGHPVAQLAEHCWCFRVPAAHADVPDYVVAHGEPVEPSRKDRHLRALADDDLFFRIAKTGESRRAKLVGPTVKKDVQDGMLTSPYPGVLGKMLRTKDMDGAAEDLRRCADDMRASGPGDAWASQLDWAPCQPREVPVPRSTSPTPAPSKPSRPLAFWPKWYHDLSVPSSNKKVPPRELDLTVRKSVAPLLLRMQWRGYPLVLSREHKWVYRVPARALPPLVKRGRKSKKVEEDVDDDAAALDDGIDAALDPSKALAFKHKNDAHLAADAGHVYFKVPHKDGDKFNVGNPLSKAFLKAIEKGELCSEAANGGDEEVVRAAKAATEMNALCSYWMSSRERIKEQMVVWEDQWGAKASKDQPAEDGKCRLGLILPQVITMGTVTRRAVEATWLTASNAKKNRVGSELKAMVRAPAGYAIVGADVDSEELWISSVMGDSQFGMHGATAIGWMTLEGTKAAGTDLHSKTASILGISRDAAKVFNYSRIYGAGKKHAVQLLLQGDGRLTDAQAAALAERLYAQTKGAKAVRGRNLPRLPAAREHLWHGGSETYLFNTLEAIALLERPTTPALGCGVTRALRRRFLDTSAEYLPSRINWVVQSSGVDYLHLLIASMEYLIKTYAIDARYLLSVHDEVRYLARDHDRHRTALALQIANAWTRALFCYNLGIDDVPQGVAFFSAVDIDHVLRKETDMACVTPSQPDAIVPGESVDIAQLLAIVDTLGEPVAAAAEDVNGDPAFAPGPAEPPVKLFADIASPAHATFLRAQAEQGGALARRWLSSQRPPGTRAGLDAHGRADDQVHALGVDVGIDLDALGPDEAEPEVRASSRDVDWSELEGVDTWTQTPKTSRRVAKSA
ncbi:DNA-directed DNA polymerase gamma mip1 [Cryptotrichosporon argae]